MVRQGKLVRSDEEFPRNEEEASFIRKTPHLTDQGTAGYQLTESREVAKDGKATVTSIRQDIWTFQEIASMSRGVGLRRLSSRGGQRELTDTRRSAARASALCQPRGASSR
jgi:hypothetical protein